MQPSSALQYSLMSDLASKNWPDTCIVLSSSIRVIKLAMLTPSVPA